MNPLEIARHNLEQTIDELSASLARATTTQEMAADFAARTLLILARRHIEEAAEVMFDADSR